MTGSTSESRPAAVRLSRRPLRPLATAFAKHRQTGTVALVDDITPTMRRVRIATDGPPPSYTPGQHIRVQINDPLSPYGILRPSDTLRTYTIWAHSDREWTIDILVHLYREDDDGIGLAWVRRVVAGERVTFWGPQGDFATRPAPYHLFIGEETGTAAFAPMIRALGPDEEVYGVLESVSADDEPPIPHRHPQRPARLHRIHRGHASPVKSSILLRALAEIELPAEPGVAYVAGEARTGQLIRDHLIRDRGWPTSAITVKPFWTPGKTGLHH